MTTIAVLLATAGEKLAAVSQSPRLDAEILLSRVSGFSRTHFIAWPDKMLLPEQEHAFAALLEQRLAGVPIAYIIGSREFWSREFRVTPDVLIPRPETELLIDLVLQAIPVREPVRIADLGTGSGVIAVTLALECPLAEVTALDLSPSALAIAQDNASRLGAHGIRFICSDWFDALAASERFDFIVGNPPYIAVGDPHPEQGDARFEPRLALLSGADGLDAVRRIVRQARQRLTRGGQLLFEHGYDQAEASRALLEREGYAAVASHRDLQGHWRVSGGQWLGPEYVCPEC